jgi:hypothetical protein
MVRGKYGVLREHSTVFLLYGSHRFKPVAAVHKMPENALNNANDWGLSNRFEPVLPTSHRINSVATLDTHGA